MHWIVSRKKKWNRRNGIARETGSSAERRQRKRKQPTIIRLHTCSFRGYFLSSFPSFLEAERPSESLNLFVNEESPRFAVRLFAKTILVQRNLIRIQRRRQKELRIDGKRADDVCARCSLSFVRVTNSSNPIQFAFALTNNERNYFPSVWTILIRIRNEQMRISRRGRWMRSVLRMGTGSRGDQRKWGANEAKWTDAERFSAGSPEGPFDFVFRLRSLACGRVRFSFLARSWT